MIDLPTPPARIARLPKDSRGYPKQNTADALERGRFPTGSEHYTAKRRGGS